MLAHWVAFARLKWKLKQETKTKWAEKRSPIYAEGLARNHAFVDGNKRTAFITADIFLYKNSWLLDRESANEQTELFENLAQGKANYEEVADFYRQNTQEIDIYENQ